MTQVAPGTSTTPALPQLHALVAGRIHAVRRISTREGALFITVVKLPAPDSYSSPQTIELRSKDRLGQQGDEWRGRVKVGGYGRSYKATDPETGEQRVVQTADNSLTVVSE